MDVENEREYYSTTLRQFMVLLRRHLEKNPILGCVG